MFVLENGDKLQGDASAATVVDYHISGITGGTTLKNLADGQLAATIGDLYTSASTDAATTITLVNTDSVARTVNLYHTPSGGTARRVIPKDLSLSAGYSVVIDGGDIRIIGTDGKLQTTAALGASEIKTLYESNANTNAFTDADESKLDGIEALADVTDATNVDAAGATMNTDADVSGNTWVVDEDDLTSDSATKVPTQQSVKAYTDSGTQTLTNKTINTASNTITIAGADVGSGTIAHERGGLEADVSAYSGLVKITGGATSAVDDPNATATTKGDLLVRNASALGRVAVGTNDQVLTADSAEASGVKWADAGGGGGGILVVPMVHSYNSSDNQILGTLAYASATEAGAAAWMLGTGYYVLGNTTLPSGLTSIDSAYIWLSSGNATEGELRITVNFASAGEDFEAGGSLNTLTSSTWYTPGATYDLSKFDISSLMTGAAAGDTVQIAVERTGSEIVLVVNAFIEYS